MEKNGWNLREAEEGHKMLEELYENNSHKVLKRTVEDRSA